MHLKALTIFKKLTTHTSEGMNPSEFKPFVFAERDRVLPSEVEQYVSDIDAPPFAKFTIEAEGEATLTESEYQEEAMGEVRALSVEEIAPDNFVFTALYRLKAPTQNHPQTDLILRCTQGDTLLLDESTGRFNSIREGLDSRGTALPLYDFFKNLVSITIQRLYKESSGSIKCSGKVKYRENGKKATYAPTDVIYVSGKPKSSPVTQTTTGARVKHIDAWAVRSFWRKLTNPESLGVDRAGNRIVKGMTFVRSHTRGQGDVNSEKIYKVTQ